MITKHHRTKQGMNGYDNSCADGQTGQTALQSELARVLPKYSNDLKQGQQDQVSDFMLGGDSIS